MISKIATEWRKVSASPIAQNAGWMLLGQGLSIACRALYFVLLARLLGSLEYGIYAGVFATVALVTVYCSLGSGYTLLRHVSADHSKFSRFWGNLLLTNVLMGIALVTLLTAIVPYFAHSYSRPLVFCVAVGDCFCTQLTDGCSRVFQAFEKMRITAALTLLISFLRTLVAATLWVFVHHTTARQWVAASLLISIIGAASALTLVTTKYGKPALSLHAFRLHIGEGFVFALSSSSAGIYNNFDKAMLGHYGMNVANGIYSMAYRVIDLAMTPISSTHEAATPTFFRKGIGGTTSTAVIAVKILKRTAPIGLALAAGMFLSAPLIPRLVGKTFTESVLALRWLCLLPFFRSLHWSAGDALTGAGKQSLRLGTQSTAAAFNFGINLYLIPHFGWVGAAWSSLATDGLLGAINWTALSIVRSSKQEAARASKIRGVA